jgi:hypothetical protein
MGIQNAWGGSGLENCIGIGTVNQENDSWSTCQFRVDKYGNMYASSGKIAGWEMYDKNGRK